MLVFILTLTACQQEKTDLSLYVAKIKARPQVAIEPIPVFKPYERFEYVASELRNPFLLPQSYLHSNALKNKATIDNVNRPDMDRLKEVLEQYDLVELSLVGALEQDIIWALIRSPDGEIHRVQTGNYMGKNYGKIITISDTNIELKEMVPDGTGSGGYIYREQEILIAGSD